jgi:transposase
MPFYRKRIIPLYWSLNSELKAEDRLELNFALETFPETQKIYAFVQSFRDSINQYDSISIQQLICNIKDGTIPELKTFAKYLFKDVQAIIASIYYTYSNGVIEGQINRLKTIKRTLYGRAGFEILRKRVLFHF